MVLPGSEPPAYSPTSWRTSAPFLLMNLIPLAVVFTGITATAVVLGVVLYLVRVLCITGGYHRYFAHRAYRLARVPQLLLAFGGLTAVQKGPLWWASHHRDHHRYADTDRDPHSPQRGFWWSHVGWITSGRYGATDYESIADFSRFPELRFLNRHDWIGPWSLGIACFLIGGWSGLVVGFFLSTVVLWHATFSVNSFAHIVGRRRYATRDSSRNNPVVALVTLGEGWHNNHHHYPACARQGFRWYEVDVTFYVLKVLSWVGIVRDLKPLPRSAFEARRIRDGNLDVGLVRYHLSQAAAVVATHPASGGADDVLSLLDHTADQTQSLARRVAVPERLAS
ncbi:MAG: acyl-CoA desaturase [Acidimicrobiales bacterium]|nr:acyl-CoA desaturase [Acidimicrobiales bacterium]